MTKNNLGIKQEKMKIIYAEEWSNALSLLSFTNGINNYTLLIIDIILIPC